MSKPMTIRPHAWLALVAAGTLATGALANHHVGKQQRAQADKASPARAAPQAEGAVRDWSKIDLNKDNLISPEEMEKWLAANPGPLKK